MAGKWIQGAVKKEGRVKRHLRRKYGDKAFKKDGTIKITYLNKAIKDTDDRSLKSALILAKRFAQKKV